MKTEDSPFIYGSTVSAASFTNRESEIEKLRNNLLHGINTMLISPRRWGKSSLVERVVHDINKNEKNIKTVIIDLFSTSGEEEFLETFAREVIKASTPKWQEWLVAGKDFFKNLVPKINIGFDPYTDFSLQFDWRELKKHSHEVLNLPETIAKKKGFKIIICLDEFQNLSSFNDYLNFEKKLRAAWQRHDRVTYCLYGSKRHMIADIFNNPSKPFYRFGDMMVLQKIDASEWINFICRSFFSTGKSISKTDAALIPAMMKNHSWYVQQLSHYTWNLTHKKASINEIETALQEVINANMPLYQKEVETISTTQINLLKAIAGGETRMTSSEVMNKYKLGTPRNVSKNKTVLMNNDTIYSEKGLVEFIDPAFELWFKRQFLGIPYLPIISSKY